MRDKKWAAVSPRVEGSNPVRGKFFAEFFFSNTILASMPEWSIYGKTRMWLRHWLLCIAFKIVDTPCKRVFILHSIPFLSFILPPIQLAGDDLSFNKKSSSVIIVFLCIHSWITAVFRRIDTAALLCLFQTEKDSKWQCRVRKTYTKPYETAWLTLHFFFYISSNSFYYINRFSHVVRQ